MKCEICESEKHCISLDLDWTPMEYVCEDCWDKYLSDGYVNYDQINEDKIPNK